VRGAFTGAVKDHQGLFARAHGSSLLLDEIDSMSPRMQVLLLRVLETGEYRPVGVTQAHWSDFRLISAGLPCFDAMVNEGGFREDLYYRMSTMRIEVPALKDRGDDCIQFARAHVEAAGKALAASACEEIRCYDWPGNIRQLHHCLDVAALHANGGTIDRDAVRVALDTYARRSVTRAGETSRARWGEAACLRAIDHFAHGKLFGVGEFAEAAGVSRRSAQRHLAALVRSERIVRQGAGRSTQYRVPAR